MELDEIFKYSLIPFLLDTSYGWEFEVLKQVMRRDTFRIWGLTFRQ